MAAQFICATIASQYNYVTISAKKNKHPPTAQYSYSTMVDQYNYVIWLLCTNTQMYATMSAQYISAEIATKHSSYAAKADQ